MCPPDSPPPPALESRFRPLIESQLRILEAMVEPNGAVLASPNGTYKAHWVRDGLYASTGALYPGLTDLTHRLIRAPFSIFHKHRAKILAGIRKKPGKNYDYLHARYHPTHFDEFEAEWGHNQLDMIGLFLYLVAQLPKKGVDVFERGRKSEDRILLNQITRYLETLEWWRCPDYGVWEEGPKRNASSLGAVLAGLRALRDLEEPDLFFNEAQLEKGQRTLNGLLPAESDGRSCDMAQLSLIWPFAVLTPDQATAVLENVEKQLVREHGVIRYKNDAYFNAADGRLTRVHDARTGLDLLDYAENDKGSFPHANECTEAQWPLGFAWLSIVCSKLAKARYPAGDHGEYARKAAEYLDRLIATAVPADGVAPGYIPELYVGDTPNINTPLTWTTAFTVVAAIALSEIEDTAVPYSAF